MSTSPTRHHGRAAMPWLVSLVLVLAFGAGATERGLPLITVFPAEVHKGGPQTFDIAQDTRGILYFGNLHGLLSYDGAWWRMLKLPDEQVALTVATDARGRVALGLVNDLGYLDRGPDGAQRYVSLLGSIPKNKHGFGDVNAVCQAGGGFLYVTEVSAIFWNGSTTRVVADFDRATAPRGCIPEKSAVLLRGPKGLQRFDPLTLRIAPAGLDKRVLAAVRRQDGSVVAMVRDEGLQLVSGDTAVPWAPEASAWLKGKLITGACRLTDGRVVITTRQHGVAIVAHDGALEQVIDSAAGIPDAVLNEPHVDHEGSLWLGMEGPLVRIDLASPVTVFDGRRGLRGGAGDVTRHAGKIYGAMTHGLYALDSDGAAHRLPGIDEGAWRLLSVDDELLVGSPKGIYRVDAAGRMDLVLDDDGSVYDMFRSPSHPQRIWIAQGSGIASIVREGKTWRFERLVPGAVEDTSTVVEHDGVLWAGTTFNGILRIENPLGARPRVQQFGSGEMNVYLIDGRPIFVRATGEILHIDARGQFAPDARLGHVKSPNGFFVVAQDKRGSVWINSTPPRVFERAANGTYAAEGKPLVSVTAADIQNLRVTPEGSVWFAADKGLFRYQASAAPAVTAPQPAPMIPRVITGDNRVVHAPGPESRLRLRHNFGRIRIEFAPVSYRPGTSYQYRLDPIDEQWSEWTAEPFIDYTTLEPNDYTFRVRARGPAMVAGGEALWTFSVLPPWYRTRWALALWALIATALVIAVIRVRTGTLRRQAEKLRARVAEQTAALQETVKLLESANAQLEALSLEDDLTGIANRRSFERALTDEWNRARRHDHPLALILLDLDYFKDLNDRRGHPAGDDCLRRVGAFLSETIRRSGEVVARYGGEEFAILLPNSDATASLRVADTLRAGIERLGIPYGTGGGRRVTASCGVASMTPTADQTPEHLVASADRALYAAKHSGRNCVRLADETTTGTWLSDVSA